MNYNQERRQLLQRNEGKIKSYESCEDVRAWSHDIRTRNDYLRDWIKSSMQICVIPVRTVTRYLRNMSWRSRGKVTPRCHPDCKSKVVLESICSSCHAINKCLNNDELFEKYYQDEEFETSHWPCERCLESLKSIKMYWKIILDKIFGVTIPAEDDYNNMNCSSIRSLAKRWEDEIIDQTIFLKKLIPCNINMMQTLRVDTPVDKIRLKLYTNDFTIISPEISRDKIKISTENKYTETHNNHTLSFTPLKNNKSITAIVEKVNIGCDNCHSELYVEDDNRNKSNIEYLHRRLHKQNAALLKENMTIKLQLREKHRSNVWASPTFTPLDSSLSTIPAPYEYTICDKFNRSKTTNSEMIITLKNCKNGKFEHISLLQVVHKTNDSSFKEKFMSSCKQPDPVDILTKVQNKVGEIVQREIDIVNEKQQNAKKATTIDACYHKISPCNSSSKCSLLSLHSIWSV